MNRIRPRRPAFLRDARGAVVIEAAVVLVMLMAATLAGLDIARYIQVSARAERVAAGLADLVSRADLVRDRAVFDAQSWSNDIGVFFAMADEMALPEKLGGEGGAVIASVTGTATGWTVNWVRSYGKEGEIAPPWLSAPPALPVGVPFIVAEARLLFNPMILDTADFLGALGVERIVKRRAIYRPRSGSLTTLEPAS